MGGSKKFQNEGGKLEFLSNFDSLLKKISSCVAKPKQIVPRGEYLLSAELREILLCIDVNF